MEPKVITIKRGTINKLIIDFVIALIISILILIVIQHFGQIDRLYERDAIGSGTYGFVSPISNKSTYYPVDGKYFPDTPNYIEKLGFFYLPSIFVVGYIWLLIVTTIVFIIFRLKRKFSKLYKIKIE